MSMTFVVNSKNITTKNWHLTAKTAAKLAVAEHLTTIFSNCWSNGHKISDLEAVWKLPQKLKK